MAVASKIKDLTGPGHTDRFCVGGTDLGVTVAAPDGRLVSVFGDTFEGPAVGSGDWRSPVVLFGDPGSVRTGMTWAGAAGTGGHADQVIAYRHDSVINGHRVGTMLPTDVITIGDRMYLHVMVCETLHVVHWTELYCSTDNGETWHPTGTVWPGDLHRGLFQMLTWERGGDGWVYAFTTGFQRDQGLILHRVPEDRITDPDAWQSWGFAGGTWGWGRPPTPALEGAYGELCLRRVGGHWLLTFFNAGKYRIDALSLGAPTANLYEAPAVTLLHGCSWDSEDHSAGLVAQLYGGYLLPGSTPGDLHLVVSQWNTGAGSPYRAMQFHAPALAG